MKSKDGLLRKSVLGLSIMLHISIVIFALTTYYTIDKISKIDNFDDVSFVEIQFTNSSKSSGMGSTKKNIDKLPKEKATARAIEEKIIKVEPLEEVDEEVIVTNDKTKVSKKVSDIEKNESSETKGDGDEGEMISGSDLGSLEFDGQGVFGRKVVFHAPIKKIAEIDGIVAINIGINRKGNVVGAAINKKESTISNRELLIKALEMILKYRFESDFSAPKTQYGKFTFIFDLSRK